MIKKKNISFTLPRDDGQRAMATLQALQQSTGFESLLYDDRIGKVSLIGAGMRSHPGVSATFFKALAGAGVNIEMISTFFFQAEDGIRDPLVTGVQTCALPI